MSDNYNALCGITLALTAFLVSTAFGHRLIINVATTAGGLFLLLIANGMVSALRGTRTKGE